MGALAVLLTLLISASCANRRPGAYFRVLPANPNYLLHAPDSRETPFPDILSSFTRLGAGWVDLRPRMELRIENAYYRDFNGKHDFANFLGTEIAHFRVRTGRGLQLLAGDPRLPQHPDRQPPAPRLIHASARQYRYYRFFYEVLFNRKAELRGAVLLGAGSQEECDRLTGRLLADPSSVCVAGSRNCTIFPDTCTVSLEIEIVVNGASRTVLWGSLLQEVAARPRHMALLRFHAGRLTPVEINPADPAAMRLPLLPGDQINWD